MFRTIFMKEMKDVLRDRRSITLLILLPMLMMAALTFFYDKLLSSDNDEHFTVGVEKNVDQVWLEQLENYMPTMNIEKFNNLQTAVEKKQVQIAIQIDPAWQEKFASQDKVPIHVIYDPSSQESSSAYNLVMAGLSTMQKDMVQQRVTEHNIDSQLLEVFAIDTKVTKDEDNAIASYMLAILIPLLIPIAIANGSYPSATELFAGEKERKTIEALLITPVKPIKILLAKWLTISLLGVFTGVLCIGMLSVLINFTTELQKGLAVIEKPILFVAMSVAIIIVFSIFIAELEMILSMAANSVKEAGYYITPVIGLLSLPMLFVFFSSEELTLPLYTLPFMNLFLFVRDAFSGQLTNGAFFLGLASYLVCIVILFPIALKMFHNHRLMLGK